MGLFEIHVDGGSAATGTRHAFDVAVGVNRNAKTKASDRIGREKSVIEFGRAAGKGERRGGTVLFHDDSGHGFILLRVQHAIGGNERVGGCEWRGAFDNQRADRAFTERNRRGVLVVVRVDHANVVADSPVDSAASNGNSLDGLRPSEAAVGHGCVGCGDRRPGVYSSIPVSQTSLGDGVIGSVGGVDFFRCLQHDGAHLLSRQFEIPTDHQCCDARRDRTCRGGSAEVSRVVGVGEIRQAEDVRAAAVVESERGESGSIGVVGGDHAGQEGVPAAAGSHHVDVGTEIAERGDLIVGIGRTHSDHCGQSRQVVIGAEFLPVVARCEHHNHATTLPAGEEGGLDRVDHHAHLKVGQRREAPTVDVDVDVTLPGESERAGQLCKRDQIVDASRGCESCRRCNAPHAHVVGVGERQPQHGCSVGVCEVRGNWGLRAFQSGPRVMPKLRIIRREIVVEDINAVVQDAHADVFAEGRLPRAGDVDVRPGRAQSLTGVVEMPLLVEELVLDLTENLLRRGRNDEVGMSEPNSVVAGHRHRRTNFV